MEQPVFPLSGGKCVDTASLWLAGKEASFSVRFKASQTMLICLIRTETPAVADASH